MSGRVSRGTTRKTMPLGPKDRGAEADMSGRKGRKTGKPSATPARLQKRPRGERPTSDERPPQGRKAKAMVSRIQREKVRQRLADCHSSYDAEKQKETTDLHTLRMIRGTFERYRTQLQNFDSDIQSSFDEKDLEREANESEEIMENLEAALLEVNVLIEPLHRQTPGGLERTRNSKSPSGEREIHGLGSEDPDGEGLRGREKSPDEVQGTRGRKRSGDKGRGLDQPMDTYRTGISGPLMPRLPKMELAKFDGEPIHWQAFWDRFNASVHKNSHLAPVDKFTYLIAHLEGRARRVIEGLQLTDAQYPVALDILKEEFGDPSYLIRAYFDDMNRLAIKSNKLVDVRDFYDRAQRNIRSLKALGKAEDSFEETFLSVVMDKLPEDVLVALGARKADEDIWTLSSLMRALRGYISTRERAKKDGWRELRAAGTSDGEDGHLSTNEGQCSRSRASLNRTTSSLISSTPEQRPHARVQCVFCDQDGDHYSDMCPKFPDVESRKLRLGNRCFICLKRLRLAQNCPVPRNCFHCKGRHHRALCLEKFGSQHQHSVESDGNGEN